MFSSFVAADSLSIGRDLIKRMSTATLGLNYTGTFVYAHNGELESMRIFHSNTNGLERERLLSLNGEAREIIRDEQNVVCIWPHSKSVAVSQSSPKTPFPEFEPEQLAQLESLYEFKHRGTDRVAGREVEVVDIRPLDDYRYGYRLSIDAETFLMLRSIMRDNSGAIVEQVMFTDIEYTDSLSQDLFLASNEGDREEWMIDDLDKPVLPPAKSGSDIPSIESLELPAGFTLLSDNVVVLPEESVVRRIMYTDGLASMSMYIALRHNDTQDELQGLMGMGAVHAYGVPQGQWHVTVVGEVPKPTVMMTGDSVHLASE